MVCPVAAALLVLAAGCGGSRPEPRMEAEQAAQPAPAASAAPVTEEPVCVDDKDQRVTCLSDADCCAGFVCGKDPELSQRLNYCIYAGAER